MGRTETGSKYLIENTLINNYIEPAKRVLANLASPNRTFLAVHGVYPQEKRGVWSS